MKLVSYGSDRGVRSGILVNGEIHDIADRTKIASDTTVAGLLGDWDAARARLAHAAEEVRVSGAPGIPIASATLLAPLPNPGAVYGAGANYADHAAEMSAGQQTYGHRRNGDDRAWHFIKSSHTVVGPDTEIELPAGDARVDWEVELAVIIGRKGKNIPVSEALRYIAGYTIAVDLSARGLSRRAEIPRESAFHVDWLSHKSFDGSCPLGPWIAVSDDGFDPHRLSIGLSINGVLKQDSTTANMIFSIEEQISHLSERLTLWPGDIILTGTPAGVGAGKNEFLKPGDRIVASIGGLGDLRVRVAT